ncbi:MAG: hypothetical protein MUO58_01165 [Anaerolineales bacterium]|jgi:outer membrane biosynthesis protein TonB|nr:hypothetical protein [Anaerolineales bacterium]
MKRKLTSSFLVTIVLTGLLLAACNGASQQVDRDPNVDTAPQQQVEEGVPVGNIEVSEGEAAPTPLPPESAPADIKPTPRPELSATDPSMVVLASGRPQLVEFFAFW